jgi:hypothetical protein
MLHRSPAWHSFPLQIQRATVVEHVCDRPPDPHCEKVVHPQRMSMHSKPSERPCCAQSLSQPPQVLRFRASVQVVPQSTSN